MRTKSTKKPTMKELATLGAHQCEYCADPTNWRPQRTTVYHHPYAEVRGHAHRKGEKPDVFCFAMEETSQSTYSYHYWEPSAKLLAAMAAFRSPHSASVEIIAHACPVDERGRRTCDCRRGEACSTVSVERPQKGALAYARAVEEGDERLQVSDRRAMPGHGVLIVYPSGRRRLVRAEW